MVDDEDVESQSKEKVKDKLVSIRRRDMRLVTHVTFFTGS